MAGGNNRIIGKDARMALLAILSMMIFGSAFWAIVIALEDIPPVTLGFLRAAIAAVFMVGLYLFLGFVLKRRRWLDPEVIFLGGLKNKRMMLIVFGTAFFGTAVPNTLQNIGMLMMDPSSTSSLASLIQGIGPVFTIFLAWILLKERMGIWKVLGLVITIPCTIFLTTYSGEGLSFTSDDAIGGFLNLLTAVSYSISGILLKTALNRKADPVALLGMNSLLATIMLLPLITILWITGVEEHIGAFNISLESGLSLIYLSVCVYAVAAIIFYKVLRSGELSKLIFFVFLLPLFSVFLGYLLLGERLEPLQILAGLILLAGVWLAQRSKKGNRDRVVRPPKV